MVDYVEKPKLVTFNFTLSPEKGRVSRYLKISERSGVKKYIDRGLEIGNRLIEPRGTYAIGKKDRNLTRRYDLPDPLKEAELLAFGVSTIGAALEEKVDQLMKEGNYALSNILDSLGSAAVDETSDRLGEEVLACARERGLNNTRAFQPGAGASHWEIKNQQLIFEYLNPTDIGVNLTSSFTMVPRKANSFVVGLGENVLGAEDLFSCEGCERTDCPYRHTPDKATV